MVISVNETWTENSSQQKWTRMRLVAYGADLSLSLVWANSFWRIQKDGLDFAVIMVMVTCTNRLWRSFILGSDRKPKLDQSAVSKLTYLA